MIPSQLNTLCAAYGNVDGMSLHSASGVDESDMLGSKVALTWGTPAGGIMSATGEFESASGAVRFVRVWDGDLFVDEFPVNAGMGVELDDQDLVVGIQHRVKA
ncbi:hypothetical protein A5731_00345 [Mycolicibacterium conceptionense]|nr:hypothetical protein A5718_29735 [Mycolicibacterium conceptionense]OBF09195.1 hypothetical protein A5731_00345 [Mycolicibacterium conceptionense]